MRLAKKAKMNKRRLVGSETGCLRFWGCYPISTQLHNLLYSNWAGNQQVRQTCPRLSSVVWKKGEKDTYAYSEKTRNRFGNYSHRYVWDGWNHYIRQIWSQNQCVNMRIIESSKMILTWRKIWIAGPTPGFKIWGVLKKNDQSWRFFSKNGRKSVKKRDKITTFEVNCSIRPVLDDKKTRNTRYNAIFLSLLDFTLWKKLHFSRRKGDLLKEAKKYFVSLK